MGCALLIRTRAVRRALTGCALLALTGSAVWTLAGSALAETFTGQVIGVTDGDTISVLRGGRREVVRLLGIDAPERRQAYGERAKQHAAALAFGKVVAVEAAGRDRHGRLLAEVRLPDGRSLNQELVRAGYAWRFRRYSTDPTLTRLEAEARGARRGLWSDPAPVPPWEHRRGRRLDAVPERRREPGRASHEARVCVWAARTLRSGKSNTTERLIRESILPRDATRGRKAGEFVDGGQPLHSIVLGRVSEPAPGHFSRHVHPPSTSRRRSPPREAPRRGAEAGHRAVGGPQGIYGVNRETANTVSWTVVKRSQQVASVKREITKPKRAVIRWLLDSDPSIRWQVKRDLTGEPEQVVAAERSSVVVEGWGARLLSLQEPDGNWGGGPWVFQS
jgi:micrococcal nuclease